MPKFPLLFYAVLIWSVIILFFVHLIRQRVRCLPSVPVVEVTLPLLPAWTEGLEKELAGL